MMQYRRRILIVSIVVMAVALVGIIYYSFFTFHIKSSEPGFNKVPRIAPTLRIHFNENINTSNVAIATPADGIVSAYKTDGNALTVSLQNIDASTNKTYAFTIQSIQSTSGKIIKNKTIKLHTADIDFSTLSSEDQYTVLQNEKKRDASMVSDPINAFLPHSTLDFSASYDEPSNTITVDLELTSSDVSIDRQAAINQYTNEAQAYLNTLGLNLDSYTIVYTPIDPS